MAAISEAIFLTVVPAMLRTVCEAVCEEDLAVEAPYRGADERR